VNYRLVFVISTPPWLARNALRDTPVTLEAAKTDTIKPFRAKPEAAPVAIHAVEDATLEFAAESAPPTPRRGTLPKLAAPVLGGLLVLAGVGAGVWQYGRAIAGAASGSLRVESDPQGAEVRIDDRLRGTTPVSLSLPTGTYTLTVQQGANVKRFPVEISSGEGKAYHISWAEPAAAGGQVPTGTLSVTSDAAGSVVSIDGIERGRTPLTVPEMAVGRHEVVVRTAATTYRRSVQVEAGSTVSLVLSGPAAPAPWGWISLEAPFAIQVLEAGSVVGTSDTDRIMLPPGEHQLELVSEPFGFRQSTTVRVQSERGAALEVTVPRVAMNINALPWAEVSIDGVSIGETPLADVMQSIGDHELVFRHPQLGEKRQVTRVTLREGSRVSVDMRSR